MMITVCFQHAADLDTQCFLVTRLFVFSKLENIVGSQKLFEGRLNDRFIPAVDHTIFLTLGGVKKMQQFISYMYLGGGGGN